MLQLENKVAFVTGGSRGIGSAIAIALQDSGAKVAVGYKSNKNAATKVSEHAKGVAVQVDIGRRSSIQAALEEVRQHFGEIEIVVNNAAMVQEKPFLSINDHDWDEVLGINLRGAFILAQETIPRMVQRKWGRIVNIVSIGGQWGGINQVHYAASKAALINLTRSLARLYTRDGITANAVAPGLVDTEMVLKELQTEEGKKKVENIPLGRIARPEEIAAVVRFLCSDEASYISGQTINVNGGMYFG